MSRSRVTVRRATRADRDNLAALLDAADLPSDAVRENDGEFYAGRVDGDVVCGGGLELHDDTALVRSVVVADDHRDCGFGSVLCDELETSARTAGVTTAYLLTTTAAGFFERQGYRRIARDDAPECIRRTTQFADTCPSTASCMAKRLNRTGAENQRD